MRLRLLIGLSGAVSLALLAAGMLWLGLSASRQPVRPEGAAGAWIFRTPLVLQSALGSDAMLLISARDACAFVSFGNVRQEVRPSAWLARPGGPRTLTACTPYFPKGSPRR